MRSRTAIAMAGEAASHNTYRSPLSSLPREAKWPQFSANPRCPFFTCSATNSATTSPPPAKYNIPVIGRHDQPTDCDADRRTTDWVSPSPFVVRLSAPYPLTDRPLVSFHCHPEPSGAERRVSAHDEQDSSLRSE